MATNSQTHINGQVVQCDNCGLHGLPERIEAHNCGGTCPNGNANCNGPNSDSLPCFDCYQP